MAAKPKITDVMSKVVGLLTPLDSNERHRVVQAAFTLLGESQPDVSGSRGSKDSDGKEDFQGFPPRAITWMRQQGLSSAQLQQIFHIQGGQAEVIASEIRGKGQKGKTINAYVLQGLRGLLSSGEPTFDDKAARQLCKHLGCFNNANHAVYMKGKGNMWIGSKDTGWRLTTPGLKQGADLVKEMTANAE
jgi:hypothetical protein